MAQMKHSSDGFVVTTRILLAGLAILGLAGCSQQNLSSMLSGPGAPTHLVQPREGSATLSLAPLVGPPTEFRDQLTTQIDAATLTTKGLAFLADPDAKGDYILRGNFIASRSNNKIILAYNVDVLDPAGTSLGRIADQETNAAPTAKGPAWSAVSAEALKSVATKIVTLVASLPKPAAAPAKTTQ